MLKQNSNLGCGNFGKGRFTALFKLLTARQAVLFFALLPLPMTTIAMTSRAIHLLRDHLILPVGRALDDVIVASNASREEHVTSAATAGMGRCEESVAMFNLLAVLITRLLLLLLLSYTLAKFYQLLFVPINRVRLLGEIG